MTDKDNFVQVDSIVSEELFEIINNNVYTIDELINIFKSKEK